jgi:hypothetical protein
VSEYKPMTLEDAAKLQKSLKKIFERRSDAAMESCTWKDEENRNASLAADACAHIVEAMIELDNHVKHELTPK